MAAIRSYCMVCNENRRDVGSRRNHKAIKYQCEHLYCPKPRRTILLLIALATGVDTS
ncbi:hypothetical protein CORMATOL_00035 [Corynebacterium matruchotii ATCC 33806]|uniref:Uncharacterized protein n=1 Tax=Corynebacterium matruchotii ATCC 33806 TaxID=566549 RepID=C0DZ97_9CORY|nr:hypothetical protein CORMATOL_00035 [Corynebacterium matruchotii ATCC 33806]